MEIKHLHFSHFLKQQISGFPCPGSKQTWILFLEAPCLSIRPVTHACIQNRTKIHASCMYLWKSNIYTNLISKKTDIRFPCPSSKQTWIMNILHLYMVPHSTYIRQFFSKVHILGKEGTGDICTSQYTSNKVHKWMVWNPNSIDWQMAN